MFVRAIAVAVLALFTAGAARAQCIWLPPQFWTALIEAVKQQQRDERNREWLYANGFFMSGIQAAEEAWWAALYRDRDYLRSFETKAREVMDSFPTQATYYQLANQAPYSVAMGPVVFRFRGANVRLMEGIIWVPTNRSFTFHGFNSIHAYSGWAGDLRHDPQSIAADPDHGSFGDYSTVWMKGYLTRQAILGKVIKSTSHVGCAARHQARYTYRYEYHAPDGTVIAFFERPVEVARTSTWTTGASPTQCNVVASEPTYYWSADGNASLDTSNKCKPVIRWSDGSTEEFHMAENTSVDGSLPPEVAGSYTPGCPLADLRSDLRKIDRNGNITTYRFGTTTQTIVDPSGRETVLTFDHAAPFRRLLSVDLPSIGAAPPHRYTITWRPAPLEVRFDLLWPDMICRAGSDGDVQPCSSFDGTPIPDSVHLVDSITIPDGRSYRFEYGPWGNLTRVTEPGGAVHEFVYGDAANLSYGSAAAALFNRKHLGVNPAGVIVTLWTGEAVKMQARGMLKERVLPDGLPGPAHETTISFATRQPCSATVIGCSQIWKEVTRPDGSIVKTGMVLHEVPRRKTGDGTHSVPPAFPVDSHGWVIGEETWSGSTLLSAQYFGDKDTGELWYDFDSVKWVMSPLGLAGNRRPRKMRMFRDGLSTTTNLVYGSAIDIDPSPSATEPRDTGGPLSNCLFAGIVAGDGCAPAGGVPLRRTEMTYLHYFPGTFDGRNLLGLPLSMRVFGADGAGFSSTPLTETINVFDEFDVTASGRPSSVLDSSLGLAAGAPRANITTVHNRVSPTKTVAVRTRYFDTGQVKSVTDARGAVMTNAPAFALCTPSSTLTSSQTGPLNHTVATVSDCASGNPLKVTDANGQSTYTQYDFLGRAVETAGPGDVLTALPQSGAQAFTRAADAPTGSGAQSGAARVSTWTEYLSHGVPGQQRVVQHVRDGSPGGSYVKTFSDGLGRTIQIRREVDPAKTGGFAEAVETTAHDGMGRTARIFVPCHAAASDSVTPHCGTAEQTTTYDALGREKVITAPGNRVTSQTYAQENGLWVRTTVNPRQFTSKAFTNLLDQAVRVDSPSSLCAGGFCSTQSTYDAAGRLLTVTDPNGNQLRQTYDGLGRRLTMADPDMGNWSFEYDDNGNLTKQTDAKGQVITFTYDVLNRLTLKDLPPTGPSPEDVTYFYDGNGPAPPADTNPAPALTSISPASVQAGSASFTLAVSGGNFVSGSVVRFNGQSRPTTFQSSIGLTAQVAAADIQTAGTFPITVLNPAPGGGVSGSVSLTVTVAPNPVPSLSGISPTSVQAGSAGFTLAVSGGNFISGSVVRINGQSRPTTFVSATALNAQLTASDVQTAGTFPITVFNPTPGGGVSGSVSLTVTVPPNPVPSLSGISPSSVQAGSAGFTLAVSGSNFISGSVVRINGANRPTTFVSATALNAQITASDVQTAGTFPITVFNPAPGGGVSGSVSLTVTVPPNPVPSLSGINPSSVQAGSAGFTLAVSGGNFISGSVVRINGANRPTTFVSATALNAQITASDVQTAGTRPITVFNPAPGGGVSGSLSLTVTVPPNPVPSLSNISPSSVQAGSAGFTLAVSGSNFISGSVVRINGANRPTTFVSTTALNAQLTASDVQTAGTFPITVFNPAPGGGASNAGNLIVNGPPSETVWVEDSWPAGASPGELSNWINHSTPPGPYSGALAVRSTNVVGLHQNSFSAATSTLSVAAGDVLIAYVYLDPASPPQQIMLQWNDGTWEHRAYWGANLIEMGTNGTNSRRFMGPLPAPGQWVRLEVPAGLVGLAGRTLSGMAFTLYDGRAIWDHAGKTTP